MRFPDFSNIKQTLLSIAEILLAMSGVVVRRMTLLRGASLLVSVGLYLWCLQHNSFTLAVWYFAIATVFHYIVLFGMFAETSFSQPWSKGLIARFGEERGFRIAEAWMTLVFFHNGASTSLMVSASAAQGLDFLPAWACSLVGIGLSCVGLPVKIWATMIVGIDTYYYRDLFLRRPLGEFQARGPYKIFANPMYGIGHLHGYGTALVAASLPALVIVAINQACVWLFYVTVERPHVRKIFAETT